MEIKNMHKHVPSNMKSHNCNCPSVFYLLFEGGCTVLQFCVWVCDPSCPKCLSPPSHPFRKSRVSLMLGATSPLSLQPDPCSWEPFQTSPILSCEQVQDPRPTSQSPNWLPDPSHPQGICLLVGAVPPLGFSQPPLWDYFNFLWILLWKLSLPQDELTLVGWKDI